VRKCGLESCGSRYSREAGPSKDEKEILCPIKGSGEISRPTERISASLVGIFSMELVVDCAYLFISD
jgi:hypothetical protein